MDKILRGKPRGALAGNMSDHRTCAVAVCKNNGRKTVGTDVLYHRFPPDPIASKMWLSRCKRDDANFKLQYATVCSHHFLAEDYKRDLKNELLGLPCKRLLKPTAVPSANLGLGEICVDGDAAVGCIIKSDRQIRFEARAAQTMVREAIQNCSPEKLKQCKETGDFFEEDKTGDFFEEDKTGDFFEEDKTGDFFEEDKTGDFFEEDKNPCEEDKNPCEQAENMRKRIKVLEHSLQKAITRASNLRKENTVLQMKLTISKPCSAQRTKIRPQKMTLSAWIRRNSEAIARGASKIFSVNQLIYLMKSPRKFKKRFQLY